MRFPPDAGFFFLIVIRLELLFSQVSSLVRFASRSVDYEMTGTMIVP